MSADGSFPKLRCFTSGQANPMDNADTQKENIMNVIGYKVGKIEAEAAMTSDIVLHPDVDFESLNDVVEFERPSMDLFPGMNRKYTPFLYDAVTGGPLSGGRYVFDTWENVKKYAQWTVEEVEFEPGVKFWDRSIFTQVDKHIWKVVGAHDFTPVETHSVNRFQRWSYTAAPDHVRAMLDDIWPMLRQRAEQEGLGSVWLLDQPDERQIAIFTTGRSARMHADIAALNRSVEALSLTPSLGLILPDAIGLTKLFDRTGPIFSIWLPLSGRQGGSPVANPSSPPWPHPTIAP